jgi:hypothetical protein
MALFLSTILLLVFVVKSVEGGIEEALGVQCHHNYPDVCIGTTQISISPPKRCSPEPEVECPQPENYTQYTWELTDLTEEDNDTGLSYEEQVAKFTGVSIRARIDYNTESCFVSVASQDCASCLVCSYTQAESLVSVDCTNVENGAELDCQPFGADSFLYPLQHEAAVTDSVSDPSDTIDEAANEDEMSEPSAGYAISNMFVVSMVVAAAFGITEELCI